MAVVAGLIDQWSVSNGRVKRLVGLAVMAVVAGLIDQWSVSDGRVKRQGGLSMMAGLRD